MPGSCEVSGCSRGLIARGLCTLHYQRERRSGAPMERKSVEDRFWEKVEVPVLPQGELLPEDCWTWIGGHSRYGYGVFWNGERMTAAHRHAYESANGPMADGLFACHRCDNPTCVNPAHIFAGTPGDNSRDMASKGRANGFQPRLSEVDVAEIRRAASEGEPQKSIADRFSVTQSTVSRIASMQRRKYVAASEGAR